MSWWISVNSREGLELAGAPRSGGFLTGVTDQLAFTLLPSFKRQTHIVICYTANLFLITQINRTGREKSHN